MKNKLLLLFLLLNFSFCLATDFDEIKRKIRVSLDKEAIKSYNQIKSIRIELPKKSIEVNEKTLKPIAEPLILNSYWIIPLVDSKSKCLNKSIRNIDSKCLGENCPTNIDNCIKAGSITAIRIFSKRYSPIQLCLMKKKSY